MTDTAFFESYDALELELPDGSMVRCKPLTLRQAAQVIRLLQRAEQGDAGALHELMTEFPRMVGAEDEMDVLLPTELPDVIARFLALRRSPRPATPRTTTNTILRKASAGGTT